MSRMGRSPLVSQMILRLSDDCVLASVLCAQLWFSASILESLSQSLRKRETDLIYLSTTKKMMAAGEPIVESVLLQELTSYFMYSEFIQQSWNTFLVKKESLNYNSNYMRFPTTSCFYPNKRENHRNRLSSPRPTLINNRNNHGIASDSWLSSVLDIMQTQGTVVRHFF